MTEPARLTNLHYKCAQYSQALHQGLRDNSSLKGEEGQTQVRNSLGILLEQGLYAFALFLGYRNDKGGSQIAEAVKKLLDDEAITGLLGAPPHDKSLTGRMLELLKASVQADDLDRVFLAQDLIATMLTYTLYHLRDKSGQGQAGATDAPRPSSPEVAPA